MSDEAKVPDFKSVSWDHYHAGDEVGSVEQLARRMFAEGMRYGIDRYFKIDGGRIELKEEANSIEKGPR